MSNICARLRIAVLMSTILLGGCRDSSPPADVDAMPGDYVRNRLEQIWSTVDDCEDGNISWRFETAIREIDNPMVQAAILQDHDRIKSLLDEGMDVNARDTRNPAYLGASWTPLLASVYFGSIPTAQLLLDAGADPMVIDAHGKSIVHLAAGGDASEKVLAFAVELYGRESINMKDLNGETPAFRAVAVRCHGPAKIQLLAHLGAALDVKRRDGYTIRFLAEELRMEDVVATLDALGVDN